MKELTWRSALIRDGFTQPGYIAEQQGLHGELRFAYRPMLPETLDNIEAHRRTKKGSDDTKVVIAAVAERLVSWNSCGSDGVADDITVENVRKLRWALLFRVYNIIAGSEPSDLDPNWDGSGEGKLPPLTMPLMEQIKN